MREAMPSLARTFQRWKPSPEGGLLDRAAPSRCLVVLVYADAEGASVAEAGYAGVRQYLRLRQANVLFLCARGPPTFQRRTREPL